MSGLSPPRRACRISKHVLRIAALCLVVTPGLGWTQSTSIRFRHLISEDGLSQATVRCILQDRRGFMWFGTEEGLNRYDGYTFKVFRHDDLDPSSLTHSQVSSIVEDRNGRIWVGTQNGLDRWDPRTETFEHFKSTPDDPTTLSHNRISSVHMDSGGSIWVGTESFGLNRFDDATDTFERLRYDSENASSTDRISAMANREDGGLWVGTRDGGLHWLAPHSDRLVPYRSASPESLILATEAITAIHTGPDETVWIGTRHNGLKRLDPGTGSVTVYDHDADDPGSLASNDVNALYMNGPSSIWVATSHGLDELRLDTGRVHHYRREATEPTSLLDDEVVSLHQDRGGVMWVGTGKGLSRWSTQTDAFGYVSESSAGLSSNTVTSFMLDDHGSLWVGTFGGGLNVFDRKSGELTRYTHDPSNPASLSDDRAMTILVDRRGEVWVGTYSGGLNRFDGNGGFEKFRHDPQDSQSLSRDGIVALHERASGGLWVGTFEGGLNRFDPQTERFVHYRASPANPRSLSEDRVQSLLEDKRGVLWVGTDGGGLNRFNPRTGEFTSYRHSPSEPGSLSSDTVYAIAEDESGSLWIGTEQGLNEWSAPDRRAELPRFEKYKKRHGLPNDVVYGILPDYQGAIWLSTNRGLSRLSLRTKSLDNFGPEHGLQGQEFNFGAHYRSGSGEMFFGGVNGFNHFFPTRIRAYRAPPPVVLTSFLKLNEAVVSKPPIGESDHVAIGYRDYVITFEFAALDYAAPERNRYAYKLEGFNEDWIELGGVRRATYTNLDPGDYVFRVKGSNNDGVWNEAGAELAVSVLPAPWETWWAYSFYAMVISGIVLSLTGAQARKLRREAEHARALEEQVEDRTQQLAERNQELVVANDRLEQAAVTDSLTGLLNRRYLTTHVNTEIASVTRQYIKRQLSNQPPTGEPTSHDLAFLMTDLDGLKRINDEHGHLAGDKAIIQMCNLLKETCRTSDTLIRWGGDEFMIVGRGLSRQGAEILCQRIRSAVMNHVFGVGDGVELRLSCSIGFAFFPFTRSKPELLTSDQVLSIADQALYIAKRSGRNTWVGIYEHLDRPITDPSRLLAGDLEQLAEEGVIQLSSSLDNRRDLVLAGP